MYRIVPTVIIYVKVVNYLLQTKLEIMGNSGGNGMKMLHGQNCVPLF